MPVWLFMFALVAVLGLTGIVVRFLAYGELDPYHVLFSLFFSLNLLASYWEICLYYRGTGRVSSSPSGIENSDPGRRSPTFTWPIRCGSCSPCWDSTCPSD